MHLLGIEINATVAPEVGDGNFANDLLAFSIMHILCGLWLQQIVAKFI